MSNTTTQEQFAARTLLLYLNTFQRYYQGVCSKGDVLSVHQMRVFSRRFINSLRTFQHLFGPKKFKKWKKSIQKAGRAASSLRDIDVYIAFLRNYKSALRNKTQARFIDELITGLVKKRAEVKVETSDVLKVLNCSVKVRAIRGSLTRLRSTAAKGSYLLNEVMIDKLQKNIAEILSYDVYVRKPSKKEELHEMRIEGKHLRYTLESLEPYYDQELNAYVLKVREFHKLLGDIHDFDVWIELTKRMQKLLTNKKASEPAVTALMKYCREMRRKKYNEFVKVWDQAMQNRFFENLLEFIYAHSN